MIIIYRWTATNYTYYIYYICYFSFWLSWPISLCHGRRWHGRGRHGPFLSEFPSRCCCTMLCIVALADREAHSGLELWGASSKQKWATRLWPRNVVKVGLLWMALNQRKDRTSLWCCLGKQRLCYRRCCCCMQLSSQKQQCWNSIPIQQLPFSNKDAANSCLHGLLRQSTLRLTCNVLLQLCWRDLQGFGPTFSSTFMDCSKQDGKGWWLDWNGNTMKLRWRSEFQKHGQTAKLQVQIVVHLPSQLL